MNPGSMCIAAAAERAGISPEQIEEVYMGNVLSAGMGQAPARQAALGSLNSLTNYIRVQLVSTLSRIIYMPSVKESLGSPNSRRLSEKVSLSVPTLSKFQVLVVWRRRLVPR